MKVDGKRVLMFEIPAAPPGVPTAWKGHFYGREGSSIAALSLAELDLIRRQSDDWSAEPCDGASIDDLDPAAIKCGATIWVRWPHCRARNAPES